MAKAKTKAKTNPAIRKALKAVEARKASTASMVIPDEVQAQALELARQIKKRARVDAIKLELSAIEKIKKALQDVAQKNISRDEALAIIKGYRGEYSTEYTRIANQVRLNRSIEAKSKAVLDRQTPERVAKFPAFALVRVSPRKVPRLDWARRWQVAGDACNWVGASKSKKIALKGSPIWQALGSGCGVFSDATGYAVPPFAYNSGLGWRETKTSTLIKKGVEQEVLSASLEPSVKELQDFFSKYGKTASALMGDINDV